MDIADNWTLITVMKIGNVDTRQINFCDRLCVQ